MNESVVKKDSTVIVVLGIVTLTVALVFAAIALIIPNFSNLVLSFKQYMPLRGLFGSSFVRFENYSYVIQSDGFFARLFAEPTAASLLTLVLSLALGHLVLSARRIRWLRHSLCTLFVLPWIVPGELWAIALNGLGLFQSAVGGVNPAAAILVLFCCSIRYAGLAALLVSVAVSRGNSERVTPLLAGGIVSITQFALLGRFDFTMLYSLPASLRWLSGIDSYMFREGIMRMQFGANAAADMIRITISILLFAAAAWPLKTMMKRLLSASGAPNEANIRDRLKSLIIPGSVVAVVGIGLAAISASSGVSSTELQGYWSLPIYIMLGLASSAVNTLLCTALARPAVCSGKTGRMVSITALLLLTALGINAISAGENLFFVTMGATNSWLPIAASGIGAVWGVWPLIFAAKSMEIQTNTDWFKRIWKPALALFAAQAIVWMNNALPSLLYQDDTAYFHPLITALNAAVNGSPLQISLLALLTLAAPAVLLLAVRTVLGKKQSLDQSWSAS